MGKNLTGGILDAKILLDNKKKEENYEENFINILIGV